MLSLEDLICTRYNFFYLKILILQKLWAEKCLKNCVRACKNYEFNFLEVSCMRMRAGALQSPKVSKLDSIFVTLITCTLISEFLFHFMKIHPIHKNCRTTKKEKENKKWDQMFKSSIVFSHTKSSYSFFHIFCCYRWDYIDILLYISPQVSSN